MDNARIQSEDLSVAREESTGEAPARSGAGALRGLWSALRPRHWMKNLLVLAPILFSGNLFNPHALTRGLLAFTFFCLVSSSGYLINDVQDLEQDRLHPLKSGRPLARGSLSVAMALTAAFILLLAGLSGALILGRAFALTLLAYALVTLAYTFLLKRQVILDVFAIAAGFVLRAVAGAFAIEVEMSSWLLICTTLLALFLGFSKRRSELLLLKEEAGTHRRVLDEYNPLFLDMMIGIVTASTVTSYLLYTISEETVRHFQTKNLLLTLPFVLYGIFRYLYLVYQRQRGGDPLETAFTDPATLVNLLLWTATVTLILYWR